MGNWLNVAVTVKQQLRIEQFAGTWMTFWGAFWLTLALSSPLAAETGSDDDDAHKYVCEEEECDAQPLSQEDGIDHEKSLYYRFLESSPNVFSTPIGVMERLLVDQYTTEIFGRTMTAGISGRITRAFLYGDNQDEEELFFVDNNNSATQIVGTASIDLNDDWRTGGRFKLPIVVRSSVEVDFGENNFDFSLGSFDEEEFSGYLSHRRYGRVSIGYGPTASDGTSESDLSGMTVISRSRVRDLAGGLSFAGGGPKVKEVFNNFDGLGDSARTRYDSPRLFNIALSTSLTDDGDLDLAARWEDRIDSRRIAAAASFVKREDGVEQVSVSASALWESGLNITGVIAGQRADERDPFLLYGKVGWLIAPFDIGPTAFGIDAAFNKNVHLNGDKATTVGLFFVQTINRQGVFHAIDLYAGARIHRLETKAIDYKDLYATMIGVRFRF